MRVMPPVFRNNRRFPLGDLNTRATPSNSPKIDNLTSVAAEKSVLGFLLNYADAIEELAGELDPRLFYYPTHQIILAAIIELFDRREPIELLTVTQYLGRNGNLDKVGGASEITALVTSPCSASGKASARHQLDVLKDLATKRRVLVVTQEMQRMCEDSESDLSDILSRAEETLEDVRSAFQARHEPLVEFMTPSQIQSYIPPEGLVLAGDCHIMRGSVCVIAGPPGVGKSRATVALGLAGATGEKWFGLPVRRRFRTMILQAENGRFRLKQEFARLDWKQLEQYVEISAPRQQACVSIARNLGTRLNANSRSSGPI
jgi:hypothetical protein